jgi:phage baseplate assembly protein W
VATIKLQSLNKPQQLQQGYTYSDLHLDLLYKYTQNSELLHTQEIKDIVVDYDLGAIRNSIINLFLTIPGQKILNPLFGINLSQFLFEPYDADTSQIIGQTIQDNITTFEPRVTINKIRVIAMPEDNSYEITLILGVPGLNYKSFQIAGVLSNSGFYVTT